VSISPLFRWPNSVNHFSVNLAEQPLEFKEQLISFTASFGVALVTQDELKEPEGINTALTRADKALYRSKLGGRNRVTVADDIL
jgi:PleD family two-component response regulator